MVELGELGFSTRAARTLSMCKKISGVAEIPDQAVAIHGFGQTSLKETVNILRAHGIGRALQGNQQYLFNSD